MTKNIFLVNFAIDGQDDYLARRIWDSFDIDGVPQIFDSLDDAKGWILDIVNDIMVLGTLKISPDTWTDSDFGDVISLFGWGMGATGAWLTVRDDYGTLVRFNIHRVNVH